MIATATEAVLTVSQSPELSLLVKGTVILGLGLLIAQMARSASASVRHLILAATFCGLLALPLAAIGVPAITVGVTVNALDARAQSDGMASTERATRIAPPETGDAAAVAPALSVPWTALGRAAWVIGATVFLIQLAFVLWRLSRLRRTGLPWPVIQPTIRSLAADAGVEDPVDVLLHEGVSAPLTFGTRGAVIMLPVDAPVWDQSDCDVRSSTSSST